MTAADYESLIRNTPVVQQIALLQQISDKLDVLILEIKKLNEKTQ